LRLIAAAAATLLLCATLLPAEARADAGRWLSSASYAELSQELAALQGPAAGPSPGLTPAQQARLADLSLLQQAIAASDDRSQIRNDSGHNLGLFTLAKRATAGTPPHFGVLAPGQESDDDFSVVGLYVPAGVGLRWGEEGVASRAAASESARVVRLLEGEQLTVGGQAPPQPSGDAPAAPAPADQAAANRPSSSALPPGTAPGGVERGAEAVTYALSLPPFALQARLPDLDSLPSFRQAELDEQPPTAPVD
jgi:hypothetical protein